MLLEMLISHNSESVSVNKTEYNKSHYDRARFNTKLIPNFQQTKLSLYISLACRSFKTRLSIATDCVGKIEKCFKHFNLLCIGEKEII